MSKNHVFLGIYSKILPVGGNKKEADRRWRVWSVDGRQCLVQEVLPDKNIQGATQFIDSDTFFKSFHKDSTSGQGIRAVPPQIPVAQASSPKKEYEKKPERQPVRRIFDDAENEPRPANKAAKTSVEEEATAPLLGQKPDTTTFFEAKSAAKHKSDPLPTDAEQTEKRMRSDFSLALIRLQTNRNKALDSLNKIVETKADFHKEHKFMFSDFGTALRRRQLYVMALRFHERARTLAPDDEHILFNMARALFESGKIEQACKYLQQAVTMAHDFQAGTDFLDFIQSR